MTDRELMQLALEALTHLQPTALTSFYTIGDRDKAIAALRERLAQPKQELGFAESLANRALPRREWQGLTIEDKQRILNDDFGGSRADCMDAAEKILRQKNT